MKEAYVEAIEIAKAHKADLILTTDPDADRVGMGFLDSKGEYELCLLATRPGRFSSTMF